MLDETLFLVSNSNFTRDDITKMSVWERRYYTDKIIERIEKRNKMLDSIGNR